MNWKCPQCGAPDNDESSLRCLNCGFVIDEQALDAARKQTMLQEINAAAVGDSGFDAASQAADLYTRTNSIKEVVAALQQDGLTEEQATEVAHRVYSAKSGLQQDASRRTMASGALLLGLGFAISIISFIVVPVTGVMVVAGGVLFAGAAQLTRGMMKR